MEKSYFVQNWTYTLFALSGRCIKYINNNSRFHTLRVISPWKFYLQFCVPSIFYSSPEPKALGGAYCIGRLCHMLFIRPFLSTVSNDFFSETTRWIVTKFHIQPPGPLRMKRCLTGPGHMTNMAPCPYMVKTFKTVLLQNQ